MSNKLLNILEKYKAKGGDEQAFMDKHTDNISVFDGPGVAEIEAASKFVPTYDRSENNYGNDEGDDEDVYEELDVSADPNYFLSIIDDAVKSVYAESNKEDREILDEIFATEEGYEEFISMVFEADEEDEDDEDDTEEDDETDEEDDTEEMVDTKPTVKEKYKK